MPAPSRSFGKPKARSLKQVALRDKILEVLNQTPSPHTLKQSELVAKLRLRGVWIGWKYGHLILKELCAAGFLIRTEITPRDIRYTLHPDGVDPTSWTLTAVDAWLKEPRWVVTLRGHRVRAGFDHESGDWTGYPLQRPMVRYDEFVARRLATYIDDLGFPSPPDTKLEERIRNEVLVVAAWAQATHAGWRAQIPLGPFEQLETKRRNACATAWAKTDFIRECPLPKGIEITADIQWQQSALRELPTLSAAGPLATQALEAVTTQDAASILECMQPKFPDLRHADAWAESRRTMYGQLEWRITQRLNAALAERTDSERKALEISAGKRGRFVPLSDEAFLLAWAAGPLTTSTARAIISSPAIMLADAAAEDYARRFVDFGIHSYFVDDRLEYQKIWLDHYRIPGVGYYDPPYDDYVGMPERRAFVIGTGRQRPKTIGMTFGKVMESEDKLEQAAGIRKTLAMI